MPLGYFAQAQFDGFQLSGTVQGDVSVMYVDQISFVYYVDNFADITEGI